MASLTKEKEKKSFQALKSPFNYTSVMQSPRLQKVIVSVGVGKVAKDKNRHAVVIDRLAKITGQKAAPRGAKKSIASFKVVQGDTIGYQVTLRGKRMYDFLDRLLNTALPRTKDFRGISPKAIDEMGNLTIGIKEHTIFPETADEELKDVFGFAVTIVTTARNKEESAAFFKELGVPFQKQP
ncbi:50S ribosomal protein L5 [Candidatus Kaiserbacteria bacterium RIFCSPHIGHO2_02_FULL_50_9]|uniref:Large ribosomal subunit protein uL5 n=1 Tax=Candidatus Kaiserbacteria bacterium RIFCSPLOWO2_01_FULL_51_21 TaxID=1798508 RepID=A0A1F6ECH5_9BACT|nr:MAG: 50S ribosomal protein L5 [Candidatus Kaiserbacteria bacterium RIFCSPHIGHO2_01_FULL_51_33]OGG63356.1 MAG: 50S ribosomal protein L5 [Candidatus Kaiserbacteria bacterium RIFCSPHIGHO2_02_FULL_50_9]OGG71385.1 MAG: 50S ribosomal protein L5 [Candidatus Kaiserbacteria bacterium RIFCSPLOWO2_01_FULL_51_21]